jgi:hypothetical protein
VFEVLFCMFVSFVAETQQDKSKIMRLPAAARSLKNEHCIINLFGVYIVEKIGVGRDG